MRRRASHACGVMEVGASPRLAGSFDFTITCYMLELYNDQLIDLLADKKKGDTPPPLAIKLVPAAVEPLHVSNSFSCPYLSLASGHAAPALHRAGSRGSLRSTRYSQQLCRLVTVHPAWTPTDRAER